VKVAQGRESKSQRVSSSLGKERRTEASARANCCSVSVAKGEKAGTTKGKKQEAKRKQKKQAKR
jgi:hypothetical protein